MLTSPDRHGPPVSVQPLRFGQLFRHRPDLPQSLSGNLQAGQDLDKIEHAQPAPIAGGGVGGQGMVDPGAVIPEHLGAVFPDKQRTVIAQAAQHFFRIFKLNFQVLRGFAIDQFQRLAEVLRQNDHTVMLKGFPGDSGGF